MSNDRFGFEQTSLRNIPEAPIPGAFSKVLQYKWVAYCRTNRAQTVVQMGSLVKDFTSSKLRSQESTAAQTGGILRMLEVYCNTF